MDCDCDGTTDGYYVCPPHADPVEREHDFLKGINEIDVIVVRVPA